jgi:alpha-beta hydrolase superfamily lysophospholipase
MPADPGRVAVGDWKLRRCVEVSAEEIAYAVQGSGPPVVLVHGTPSCSLIWRNVAPTLATHFSVYVLDLLGFGDSAREEGLNISIAAQARMMREVIEEWGLDAPSVAGHDIGGGIVMRAHLLEGVRFGASRSSTLWCCGPGSRRPPGTSRRISTPTAPCPRTSSKR